MKKTVMALVCSCVALSSSAQIADLASNHVQQPTALENKYVQSAGIVSPVINQSTTNRVPLAPGLRMRKVGQTMTIIGGILFVGGIVVVSQADATTYSYQSNNGYTQEEGDPQFALGLVMITHGAGLTVPGIILWNKGAKKFNRWAEEQRQQHISLGIQRSGLGLHYRF